jgi:hypothetical protein
VTSGNATSLAVWATPGRGPAIPENVRFGLGFVGIVAGSVAAVFGGGPWFFAAGLIAHGLLNAKPWEPE